MNKANKLSCVFARLAAAALVLMLACSCQAQAPVEQPTSSGELTASQTDTHHEPDDRFVGCIINVVKPELNAQGEAEYVSRDGEAFQYDGKAISTFLSVGNCSSFPADAKVFVMTDGRLTPIIAENGERVFFLEHSFGPAHNDGFIPISDNGLHIADLDIAGMFGSANTANIPLTFEPVFSEIKDSYKLCFGVYLYNSDLAQVTSELPSFVPAPPLFSSFGTLEYDLTIAPDGAAPKADGEVYLSAPESCIEYDDRGRVQTDSLVQLSPDVDMSKHLGYNLSITAGEPLYLSLYYNTTDRYRAMIFVDGELFNAFASSSVLQWDSDPESVFCTTIATDGLPKGLHIVDICTFSLDTTEFSTLCYALDIG